MKTVWLRRVLACAAIGLSLGAVSPAQSAELTITCGGGGAFDYCPTLAHRWADKTGNTVKVVTLPNDPTVKLSLFQQLLGAQSDAIDVMMVDIVWPGLLANHFVDLRPYLKEGATDGFFPALIRNNTIDGRLVAMPWFTDAGLFYYRKDLLDKYHRPVPQTWQEMTETARYIQRQERASGHDGFWGFVFQGRAYEGLTCDALEWVASFGGGSIVDSQGQVTIDNPRAAAALDLAASWVGQISPRGVLNYTEEEARGVFQTGNALFMRNWPYAWSLTQSTDSPIRGKVGVAALPHAPGQVSRSTLGGWNFAVSRYSKHKKLAVDLVSYMTARAQQKDHAIKMGMNPTRMALYDDPEVVGTNPAMKTLRHTLEQAVLRPAAITGPAYPRVTNIFFNQAHRVLSGKTDGTAAVANMAGKFEHLSRRGW